MKARIVSLPIFMLMVAAAISAEIVVDNATDSDYRDAYVDDVNFTGSVTGSSGAAGGFEEGSDIGWLTPGKLGAEKEGDNRERMPVMFFKLPKLKPGDNLKKATLRLHLVRIVNEDADVAKLGPASLFHHLNNNDANTRLANWDEHRDTKLDVATADSALGSYHEVDVTKFVKEDYKSDQGDQAVSCFHIAMDNAPKFQDTAFNKNNHYRFVGGDAEENIPQLVLTIDSASR